MKPCLCPRFPWPLALLVVFAIACGDGGQKENTAPMAVAGPDLGAEATIPLTLDGGESNDPDGDALTFRWQLVSAPSGSVAVLTDAGQVEAGFVPDVAGEFVISLVVNDGTVDSSEDLVTLTVTPSTQVPVEAVTLTGLLRDWQYADGPRGGGLDTILYYEVTKDYSIDLKAYFDDLGRLPGKYFKWDHTEAQRQISLRHMDAFLGVNLPVQWEFIEVKDAVLTLKKGYRWDGASTPWNTLNIADNREFYLRCSAIHDALYDLMRMEILPRDEGVLGAGSRFDFADPRFQTRFIADSMIYMIMIEDGRSRAGAQIDFEIIRLGGANKTGDADMLTEAKFHVSELTAWPSASGIDLHWLVADASGRDPNRYFTHPHSYAIARREGAANWEVVDQVNYLPGPAGNTHVFYEDAAVTPGETYQYRIASLVDESSVNWKERRHDKSATEVLTLGTGSGNALQLTGTYESVAADTLPGDLGIRRSPFGGHLAIEAWVQPAAHPHRTALLAFNASNGGDDHLLDFDGETGTFCYRDGADDHCGTTSVEAGTWHHLAVIIDERDRGTLLVDGQEEASFFAPTRPRQTDRFSIGQERSATEASRHFKGLIDEVRIWSTFRDPGLIEANRCNPLRGDAPGLIGLWHFDEPEGAQTFHDATRHGHPAIRTGVVPGLATVLPSRAMSTEAGEPCAP